MGDRVVYTITEGNSLSVNLYSHWGGSERFEALAAALEAARPRWNDPSYCTRIIVSQLIGDQWDQETGFGLWASNEPGNYYGGDWPDITINIADKTVNDETGTHSFDDFINYHMMRQHYLEGAQEVVSQG